eukprot:PhM_4_TR3032/c0_g1_i1/m.93612
MRETRVHKNTVSSIIRRFEAVMSRAHILRYKAARNQCWWIQKDETCFSKIKKGGPNRNRRVRKAGSTWVHVLVKCNSTWGAQEVFAIPVNDRRAETLVEHVVHLASGRLTNVWTDSFRSNIPLMHYVRWKAVNHRREWITPDGVHTNTVESMNGQLKATRPFLTPE